MKIPVVGVGVISAIGNDYSENLASLLDDRHGIITDSSWLDPLTTGIPTGKVNLTNDNLASRLSVNRSWPRTALLGLMAAREALQGIGIRYGSLRCGFFNGTTVGGMDLTEQYFIAEEKKPGSGRLYQVVHHECGRVSKMIADELKITGHILTINTACSSSANAIMQAARYLENDLLDLVVAGGTDALTAFTLNGFNSLLLLDNEPCRPFDARRKGLNLGEGAGFLVMVSEKVLHDQEPDVKAWFSGYHNASDAFHQTALSDQGNGPFLAMSGALKKASLKAENIDYLNAHGTATPNNDLAEGKAMLRVFGECMPAFSSSKSFTGHTLGASGGIEAVYSVMAIERQRTINNLRFGQQMAELGISPEISCSSRKIRHVLSNSFGFGGNCTSLIFSSMDS